MTSRGYEIDPTLYVRAAHFIYDDDAALFSALASIDKAVKLVIVEDPENPLLRRHAEIHAEEVTNAVDHVDQQFPDSKFAEVTRQLFSSEGSKDRLIEEELGNLREIIDSPGMGVFAVYGDEADVVAFIKAHIDQPDPR